LPADCLPRRESLLAGALGQAAFGDQLFASDAVSTHPLFVAGWAGLIINAINMLPAGELDGGRTFLGGWCVFV
jgi:membrane-associated protease RseP (regulator of RpoE activity)